jgi:hypothetical protein
MTVNRALWRDQQLNGIGFSDTSYIILHQEQIMLDFLSNFPGIVWKWAGDDSSFKRVCENYVSLSDRSYDGVILFGEILSHLSTQKLVDKIKTHIQTVKYAYVGVNRYEIVNENIDTNLPDSIEDSLDYILHSIHPAFRRLHTFDQVTGDQMVAVHPMDCYGLCK